MNRHLSRVLVLGLILSWGLFCISDPPTAAQAQIQYRELRELGRGSAEAIELICVGEGHRWAITDVAWSPDGQYIATAGGGDNDGEDARAIIWDARTCQAFKTYDTHSGMGAYSVSWSPDTKQILLKGQLWDVTSGQKITEFNTSKLYWNPRNRQAATITIDGKYVEILDVDSGQQMMQLGSASSGPNDNPLAWALDGRLLASADSQSGVVKIWDTTSGSLLISLRGLNDQINTIVFSPDNNYIAAAGGQYPGYYGTNVSQDNTIRIWNVHSGQLLAVLVGHTGAISRIGWSADGQRLASVSADETIRVWQIVLS